MRYELFIRATSPSTDAEAGEASLQRVHEQVLREAVDLTLELYCDAQGRLAGFDLGADPDQPGGIERLCAVSFGLAERHALVVFDPQLGRTVTLDDREQIGQQAAQAAAFAVAAPVMPVAQGQRMSPTLRLWLVVSGLVVLLLLAGRALSCAVR